MSETQDRVEMKNWMFMVNVIKVIVYVVLVGQNLIVQLAQWIGVQTKLSCVIRVIKLLRLKGENMKHTIILKIT